MKKPLFFILFLLITVNVYAQELRIVSLAPNTTEILFVLGLGDSVVGVDEYSDYPEEARYIQRVGSFDRPDIENIILLKPDYILVNTDMVSDKKVYLEGLGIKFVNISPKNIEGLCKDIEMLGNIFNKQQAAGNITGDIRRRLKALSMKEDKDRPKVFVQLFDDPLVTASSFIGDVIRVSGGKNVASDIKDDAGLFSMEELINRNPDIIIAIGFSSESKIPSSVKAVKNNSIIKDLDPDILLRPGPRIIDAIEALNRIFCEKS
ncbi:MAG: helical backbone metal receptor [Candidatus Omnitrophota bacterium]